MTTRVYPGRQQKMVASAAALGAHLLFIALLVLGVSWHRPYVPPVNVVDLGLIYDCHITPLPSGSHRVDVKMTLTAPGCGMGPMLAQDVQNKVISLEGVDDVAVELVWDPPWNQGMMTEQAKLQLGLL